MKILSAEGKSLEEVTCKIEEKIKRFNEDGRYKYHDEERNLPTVQHSITTYKLNERITFVITCLIY